MMAICFEGDHTTAAGDKDQYGTKYKRVSTNHVGIRGLGRYRPRGSSLQKDLVYFVAAVKERHVLCR